MKVFVDRIVSASAAGGRPDDPDAALMERHVTTLKIVCQLAERSLVDSQRNEASRPRMRSIAIQVEVRTASIVTMFAIASTGAFAHAIKALAYRISRAPVEMKAQ